MITGGRRLLVVGLAVIFLVAALVVEPGVGKTRKVKDLRIGVKHRPEECEEKVRNGHMVIVRVAVTDAKGNPLPDETIFTNPERHGFRVGYGRTPYPMEQGILGACVGEIRRLRFPAREYKRFEEKEQTGIATDMHPDEILRIEVEVLEIRDHVGNMYYFDE